MRSKKARIIVSSIAFAVLLALAAGVFFLAKEKSDGCRFLTDASWVHYDDIIGENLNITFHENREFIYYCDCGEPVGDSDIYDTYTYNPQNRTITLSGPGGDTSTIEVLYYDEYYLCLLFEEGTVTFDNEKASIDHRVLSSAVDYVGEEVKPYLSVLSFENGKLTVAPYNYDKDAAESFAKYVFELNASKDISFSSVSVTVEGENQLVDYFKLTEDDYPDIGEYHHTGYIEFNNNGEVVSVVFYGTLEIHT